MSVLRDLGLLAQLARAGAGDAQSVAQVDAAEARVRDALTYKEPAPPAPPYGTSGYEDDGGWPDNPQGF